MKSKHGYLTRWASLITSGCGLAVAAGCLLFHPSARADVEVPRRWATTPPVIDGTVAPGEWNTAVSTLLDHGFMRTMNDGNYLYVLLDIVDDTVDDPVAPGSDADFFALYIDKDLNFAVTPNVDFFYSSCNDGRPFVKATRLSLGASTGCQDVNTNSLGVRSFGPTFNSSTPHRFWEFRLAFDELGVDPSTWSTSGGSFPKVRVNVCVNSHTPAFYTCQPDTSTSPDNSNMFAIQMATLPTFPPGSTGPVFAGVGLVPADYIDSAGYANINISGYYAASNAPFGGKLNVFGHWNTLRYAYGAARYRVLYSKDGGPYTHLRQTWTNFRYNGSKWVATAIGPDLQDAYTIPPPWEIWYLPNLLISWQTGTFGDGTYALRLELLNAGGYVLSSPPGNLLTLFVDNTPPTPTINDALYDGSPVCECGIVTQGDFPHGFTFDISVIDPLGALSSYALRYTYGNNLSGGISSDAYVPGHVNADGPEMWNGVTNRIVPSGFLVFPWRAPQSCAYTFILSARSRIQNGYGLVFPYVDYKKSLTILTNSGTGSIDCP